MRTIQSISLGLIAGQLALLPVTVLYLAGAPMLLIFTFGIATPVVALPGFGLYAVWRLLFLTAYPSARDAEDGVPAYLWAGITIGLAICLVILASFITAPLVRPEDAMYGGIFAAPALVALTLIYVHIRRHRLHLAATAANGGTA